MMNLSILVRLNNEDKDMLISYLDNEGETTFENDDYMTVKTNNDYYFDDGFEIYIESDDEEGILYRKNFLINFLEHFEGEKNVELYFKVVE